MSNGNPRSESIWPLITLMVGVVAIGAVAWDVMLHKQNQDLQIRVQKMETQLAGIEKKEKAAEDAASLARRKARAAAAAQNGTGSRDEKTPGK